MPSPDISLQHLMDHAAIVDVAVAYAAALDTKDWAALGSLFTSDATWEYAGSAERLTGPDAIVARIAAPLRSLRITQHLCGNHTVTLRGDEAEHACYVQAQHVGHDGRNFLGAGRYTDRLRRTPDGWRFTHRLLTAMWSDGDPAVLAG